mmetsp:Transcript_27978/g.68323  ORF Transcript_27978/g.68323 Transcript_27978/m.68323 type:complete len:218 (+) Transcript_27978:1496-2149(+)
MYSSNFAREVSSHAPPMPQMRARKKMFSTLSLSASRRSLSITSPSFAIYSTRKPSMTFRVERHRLGSTVATYSLRLRLWKSIASSRWASNSFLNLSACGLTSAGRVRSQLSTMALVPTDVEGSRYMIPTLETVAGEATAQSSTSKSIRSVLPLSLMRSPLGRHRVLLSSSTVFMFSIQMASMGPSNTINFLSGVVSTLALRMTVEPSPSVHSLVSRL